MSKTKISWPAFIAWIAVALIVNFGIFLNEELGILHKFGLNPITWDAVADPRLAIAIALGGLDFTAWWLVHWYRRKYGDLKPQ